MSPGLRARPLWRGRLCLSSLFGPGRGRRKCRSEPRPRRNVVDRNLAVVARTADPLQRLAARRPATMRAMKTRQERPSRAKVPATARNSPRWPVSAFDQAAGSAGAVGAQACRQHRLGDRPVAGIVGARQRSAPRLDRPRRLVVAEKRRQRHRIEQPASAERRRGESANAVASRGAAAGGENFRVCPAGRSIIAPGAELSVFGAFSP